jgi:uncharacterized protein (UPF0264 family)
MTAMLASVNSVEEALLVLNAGVDIIDLKQPALGALGALELVDVKAIVAAIAGRRPVSATIGDLPMQAELIFNAVQVMAETGVAYIKIGFFPGGDWLGTLKKLGTLVPQNQALIAVLFADAQPDLAIMATLKDSGFVGVMLDTMDKQQGSLTQVMTAEQIAHFVSQAKELKLLCGLAGSLRLADIPELIAYHPDYLGFRGALCKEHNRVGQLNQIAVQAINLVMQAASQELVIASLK